MVGSGDRRCPWGVADERLGRVMAGENPIASCSDRPPLDPCCDYVVFESVADATGRSPWAAVLLFLKDRRRGILEQSEHRVMGTERSQLTIKLHPDAAADIMSAVMSMALPEDIVVFFYHRSVSPLRSSDP
jgi:hypothetical protein